jgi:catechol 2,3-dioxygenase-like lactoylglutathione lyase family enzyme
VQKNSARVARTFVLCKSRGSRRILLQHNSPDDGLFGGDCVHVKRLAWLGTRTERSNETTAFFRDTLGLSVVHEEPGFAMLRLPGGDHDYVEVFATDDPDVAFYNTGPVVGFLVDDVDQARAELEAAGVELIGSIERSSRIEGYGWFHFRGPDGNVYGVLQGTRAVLE